MKYLLLLTIASLTSCGTTIYFGEGGIEITPPSETIVIPTK